ncbi:MAG: DNA recombination protein RmuC [Bacteroidetes bacterium]|jgi:DNA recombination protein RmuC|nr:DNA recombination protein RmuC [Bacteroidota bacterium]
MDLLFLIIGLVIGAGFIYIILKSQFKSGQSVANSMLENIQQENKYLKENINEKEKEIIQLNSSVSSLESDRRHYQEKLAEQKKEISELYEKFNVQFKNLANEILEEKSKKFTEQNKVNIGEILKPLREKIEGFEKKVEETYDKESKIRFSLKEEVKRLAELNVQVSKETQNLTKALKGESKTQGNWGEVILESILEKSGLAKDREYYIQPSYTDNEGKRLQPDVIVTYPGDRNVVIDSKVSLVAYEKFVASEEEEERNRALKEHLISIRNHIQSLSNKNYQDLYQLNSLDFVMLFMPVEPAYLLAIQSDPELWNYAYERRILLISPTNLIAALKMIVSLWRQEYQNRHAVEIAQKSGDLYDKFVGFVEDLLKLGNQMKSANDSYSNAMKKLSEGTGNLVKRAQDIKDLGVKTKKDLPTNLLERAEKEE